MVYLFMLLSGSYAYALYAPSAWARFTEVVLSGLLAFALWQKVRDVVPYLLDPTEAPPASIAVSDGVMCALAFFIVQGIAFIVLAKSGLAVGPSLLFAFVIAGVLVALVAFASFHRQKLPHLLPSLGFGRPVNGLGLALVIGVFGGALAAAVARGYLAVVDRLEPLRHLREQSTFASSDASLAPWIVALAVLAAPLVEEFIFRGILFAGFRRTLKPSFAVLASAAVFAIVHPAISFAPVFVLGVVAASVYERSRSLLSPIAAHMTYNAIVVWLTK